MEDSSVLLRICSVSGLPKKTGMLNLSSKSDRPNKLIVGRGENCNISLREALSVSRQHCQLEPSLDGTSWTITDLKSGNGTFVNGVKLKPRVPHVLQEGDIVEIGKDDTGAVPTAYTYRYYKNSNQALYNPDVTRLAGSNFTTPCRAAIKKNNNNWQSPTALMNTKIRALEKQYKEQLEEQKHQLESLQQEKWAIFEQLNAIQDKHQQLQGDTSKELQEKREEMNIMQRDQELLKEKLETLQKERTDIEVTKENELREQQKKMETLQEEKMGLGEKLQELQRERQLIQQQRQKELEEAQRKLDAEQNELVKIQRAKEAELGELGAKLNSVQEQYNNVMQNLKTGEDQLRNELQQERCKLEKNVQAKEHECKTMMSELGNVRQQMEQVQDELQKQKSSMLSTFEDAMESELQCPICSEMFIEAYSLGCSHSFCSYCIEKWMEKKKECPECRAKITSFVRSRVLDNYIEKVVEFLGEAIKDKRKEALEDRKIEMEAFEKQKKEKKAKAERNVPQQRNPQQAQPRNHQPAQPARNRTPETPIQQRFQQMGYNVQPQNRPHNPHWNHQNFGTLENYFVSQNQYYNQRTNQGYQHQYYNRNPFRS